MVRLSNEQLKQLAGFTSNLGIVFAAGVMTPLFSNVDGLTSDKIILGLGGVILSVMLSLILSGGIKK